MAAVPPPARSHATGRGILWMLVSCVAFAAMWVVIRFASHELHSFEIVFFRNFIGLMFLVPMLLSVPGLLRSDRMKVHLRRATSGFIATQGTFFAVANAPLATALAINYTAPLFATAGAVLFLGERIRARRLTALAIGFLGMLVVVRPGALPMTWGIAAAVISAISTGFSLVAVRQLTATDDSRAVAAWTFVLTTPPSLLVALTVWKWPSAHEWPLLVTIGALAAIGQLTLSRAFALAEASAVMPFDFLRFALVTIAGIAMFGERYDALTLVGGAVIFASTVYLALREAQLRRRNRMAEAELAAESG